MGALPNIQFYDYRPEGASKELFSRRDRELFISGPAGTGKSRSGLEKINWALEKYPQARGFMARKTRRSLTQSAMITLTQEVFPHSQYVPFHGGDQEYRYPNGSILHVAGLDDPQKLLSSQWDIGFIPQVEELNEENWQTVARSRMRNQRMPYAQVIGDCNPGPPDHWILARVDKGSAVMLKSRHEDNPLMYDLRTKTWTPWGLEYLADLDALTGVLHKRLRLGIWAGAEGTVYESEWDSSIHVIDRFYKNDDLHRDQVPKDWPRYWVVDFGYTNPFCFDEKTEILSKDGWVEFSALKNGVEVGTLHPETHRFEWQVPTDYINYEYDGDLVIGGGAQQSADFAVTPDHRMVVENRKTKKWKKTRADELPQGSSIPTGWLPLEDATLGKIKLTRLNRKRRDLASCDPTAFARLIGLVLADGELHLSAHGRSKYVRITQSSRPEAVCAVLNAIGWKYCVSPEHLNGTRTYSIGSADLYEYLEEAELKTRSHLKRIPREMFGWGKDALAALLEGLMIGDGSYRKLVDGWITSGERYHTSSRGLADDVQQVACMLGMASKIHEYRRLGGYENPSTEMMYTVHFHSHDRAAVEGLDLRRESYKGRVYCVTVPNGILVVRRNGRPMACGNCWQAWAQDPDGRLFRYKEIYKTKTRVEDHAKVILEYTAEEPKPRLVITDHDAEDRSTLEKYIGMGTKRAWKAVSPGIQAVAGRLKVAGDGKPRLFYLRDSLIEEDRELAKLHKPTKTEKEYDVYVWDTSNNRRRGEEPKKEFDHGQDATRYLVTMVDETWKVKHRFGPLISVTRSEGGGEGFDSSRHFGGESHVGHRFGGPGSYDND